MQSKTRVGVGGKGMWAVPVISSSRDGGDKIFTASKGGAWEGPGRARDTPAPYSLILEAGKGRIKNGRQGKATSLPLLH